MCRGVPGSGDGLALTNTNILKQDPSITDNELRDSPSTALVGINCNLYRAVFETLDYKTRTFKLLKNVIFSDLL